MTGIVEWRLETMRSTAMIVSSFIQHRDISQEDLPRLIDDVHTMLVKKLRPEGLGGAAEYVGVSNDFIISKIDGKPYKLLTNHLKRHNLTPSEYRRLYDLPNNYPMVAPSHSEKRRQVAIANFGGRRQKREKTVASGG